MAIIRHIQESVVSSLTAVFGGDFTPSQFQINTTVADFEGDYTIVLFALVKQLRQSPDALGTRLGDHLLQQHPDLFARYNIIKGFLNLTLADTWFTRFLVREARNEQYGYQSANGQRVMVEYSSPNTNKPLHLGHLRNNFLGWSVAEILKANGYDVIKSCIVNDRGIHICKSMIAWQRFANGATPQSTGIKGDHFVGDYYVQCETEIRQQAAVLAAQVAQGNFEGISPANEDKIKKLQTLQSACDSSTEAGKTKAAKLADDIHEIIRASTPIMIAAQQMLLDWEAGKPEVLELWRTMNGWVYAGFDATYARIGSDFDKIYYESDTYLLGKATVQAGLEKQVFVQREDGSVWIDLSAEGLDEKLVQRKDGTSVYITQDIGLAQQKYDQYKIDKSIYVIGNEQNYHMKVLQLICKRLGMPYADDIYHLSYGMVELPHGRMKSREGTVVDADDLLDEMIASAAAEAQKNNADKPESEFNRMTAAEQDALFKMIGPGAMKYYLLKVDPKKTMVFNPEESIEFTGFTGAYIQYTHARIKSILRKEALQDDWLPAAEALLPLEKELLLQLEQYPNIIAQAGAEYNPASIAHYVYHLARTFNSFYTEHAVANAETPEKKQLRLYLLTLLANVIRSSMGLLGIGVPERM
jgi:arginyl-tRNA synthetase